MKISIIVPVYNCSRFLPDVCKCLMGQTGAELGKDYDVIFVNDGSTDDSLNVLKSYEQDGISVIDKPNGGVSTARNVGLEYAKGEYVWFVDGDDCINSNSVALLLQLIEKRPSDAYSFRFKEVPEDFKPEKTDREELVINDKVDTGCILTPWLLVVKREHLLKHNIRFKEGMSYSEDTMWMVFVTAYPLEVVGMENVLYYYRQQSQSVVHIMNETALRRRLDSQKMMIETYHQALVHKDMAMTEDGVKSIRTRMYWSIQNILLWGLTHKQDKEEIIAFLNEKDVRHYPVLWGRFFGTRSLGELKANMISLLFPYDWYYNLITKIL